MPRREDEIEHEEVYEETGEDVFELDAVDGAVPESDTAASESIYAGEDSFFFAPDGSNPGSYQLYKELTAQLGLGDVWIDFSTGVPADRIQEPGGCGASSCYTEPGGGGNAEPRRVPGSRIHVEFEAYTGGENSSSSDGGT